MEHGPGLARGTKVGGQYEVVGVIGYGGMGVVYRVREQVGAVSRDRALKTVLPQHASNPSIVARFREEAEKMCLLEHENIVPVLKYSEEGEFPYLVMPFIEGQTLREYLRSYMAENGRPLPLAQVMEIGIQLVLGLDVAHRFVNPSTGRPQPIIHRDIKPGNIMIRQEQRAGEQRLKVLIMDFGIAKLKAEEESGMTLTDVIGTVKYAAPEQVQRTKAIDPRADIYSLGMVLYEAYCGRHVLHRMSEHGVLMRLMQREVEENDPEFPPGTPPAFEQLIRRCIAVRRANRYSEVGELLPVMRQILEEELRRRLGEVREAESALERTRKSAIEQGAGERAAAAVAEGDLLARQAREARDAGDPSRALHLLRAAASAFEQSAYLAHRAIEREALRARLAAVEELREAALAAGARTLAPEDYERAERATEAARGVFRSEEALDETVVLDVHSAGSGGVPVDRTDLAKAAESLDRAEVAWRAAAERAAKEEGRRRVEAMGAELREAIAREAASLSELPKELRSRKPADSLEQARQALAAAEGATGPAAMAAIEKGRAALEAASGARREALGRAADRAAATLRQRLDSLASEGARLAPESFGRWRAAVDAALEARDRGAPEDALRAIGAALAEADRLEQEIERLRVEHAERERRAEARAAEAREDAVTARTEVKDLPSGGAAAGQRERAEEEWRAAEEAARAKDWAGAEERYRTAAGGYRAAVRTARIEEARPPCEAALARWRTAEEDLAALGGPHENEAERARALREAFRDAERLYRAGELPEARGPLEAAVEGLAALVARTAALREKERLARRREELVAEARRRAGRLHDVERDRTTSDESRRLLEELARLENAGSPVHEAIGALEALCEKLSARAQLVEREIESERARGAARQARTRAREAEAQVRQLGSDATTYPAFAEAAGQARRGEEALGREDFRSAVDVFEAAAAGFAELTAHVVEARRQERLLALRGRKDATALEVARLPAGWALRATRKRGRDLVRRCERALDAGNESDAEAALAECAEALRAAPAAAPAPASPVPRSALYAAGGAVAVSVVAVLLWRGAGRETEPQTARAEPTVVVPTPAEIASVPAAEEPAPVPEAPAEPPPAVVEEAPVAEEAPAVEAAEETVPAVPTPSVAPTALVARVPEAEPPKPPPVAPPELRLARVEPRGTSVTLDYGARQRFEAKLAAGDADRLRWKLDGVEKGRGATFLLPAEATRSTGDRRLALLAERDGRAEALWTWTVRVRPPRLEFASVEPAARRLETSVSDVTSFRASVGGNVAGDLSYRWEVNGTPVRGVAGDRYQLKPAAAGEYTVRVRADGPGGSSTERSWTVVAKAPPPPTVAPAPSIDPKAEVRGWIQEYCRAFEQKDIARLRQLGLVKTEDQAERLRRVLAEKEGLRTSCTGETITVQGDSAQISFDRTEEWQGPRGKMMTARIPREEKTLRRIDGRWRLVD